MTPTPEQIAAMEARGWTHLKPAEGDGRHFGIDIPELNLIMRVWWDVNLGTGWRWDCNHHWHKRTPPSRPDPLAAADKAEAWLRSVLAGFRFPWLRVDPTP